MDHQRQLPDNLVDAFDIADRLKVTTSTVWRRVRKMHLGPDQGAWKIGTRNWRFDPRVFPKYFLGADGLAQPPSAKPPAPAESQENPTRRDALNQLTRRMDGLQASLTRVEDKLDRFIRNGRAQDGTKRLRRS
jgi:hypothetical protein